MENYKIKSSETCSNDSIEKKKSTINILVVEDDLSLEPIWFHILNKLCSPVQYDWAYSYAEADRYIKKADKKKSYYDLILSDVFIYGAKSGIDLWNEQQDKLHPNIILMSSIEPDKIKNYLKTKKVPDYIQKPIDIEATVHLLNQHIVRLGSITA